MENTSTPAAEEVSSIIARRVAFRMEKIARFANVPGAAAATPARLRRPFSVKSWQALPEDVRLRHLTERVREHITGEEQDKVQSRRKLEAERAARTAASKRPAPAPVEAPDPAETAPTPVTAAPAPTAPRRRRVVSCIAGCGEYHPASSPKPVVVSCGGWQATATRNARDLFSTQKEVSREGTEYLIRTLRREAEEARRLANSGAEAKKQQRKPKPRRRAICSNTK